MKPKSIFIVGSVFSFLSVALGAFAAHGLKLDAYSASVFETAARYQFYHSLALLILAIASVSKPHWVHSWTPRLFIFGIVIFSGSLYLLAITGIKILGAITPIGGTCFLTGWFLQIITVAKKD